MFASRLSPALRALPRQASALRMARRGYAEAAAPAADGKLKLSLVLPHQSLYSSAGVIQVNIPAATGDMGILANHVPSVEALRAGVIEVIEENGQPGKKWFVSSGFATVHSNNTLTVNAVEAYTLDSFSPENIRSALADANRVLGSSAPESEKAEARVEVEVFEGLQAALNK